MKIQVPESWQAALEEISSSCPRRVLILGAVDVGKSTLCFYLLQGLLKHGWQVALVDADVGQKDVGPPATVGLRHFREDIPPRPLEAEKLYFVGSTSPVGHLLPLVVGTRLLCDQSKGRITLINTTGLIHGPGVALKNYQIESLRPDLILALERNHELDPILSGYRYFPIRRLEVSPLSRSKGPRERQQRREEAYRQHFAQAVRITLALDKLVIQRPPRRWRRNLLCAVSDQKEVLSLAILEEIDFTHRTVTLFTPANPYRIRVLICGSLYVSRLGEELGKVRPRREALPSEKPHSLRAQRPYRERPGLSRLQGLTQRRGKKKNLSGPKGHNVLEKGE